MKKMMICILALGGFSLQAQVADDDQTFTQWDVDRDGYIMDEEYDSFWRENNSFAEWDKNRNGSLDEKEWNMGVTRYYGSNENWQNNAYNSYALWDNDNDSQLDESEFREGNYNTWDVDRDGRIAEAEYRNFYRLD